MGERKLPLLELTEQPRHAKTIFNTRRKNGTKTRRTRTSCSFFLVARAGTLANECDHDQTTAKNDVTPAVGNFVQRKGVEKTPVPSDEEPSAWWSPRLIELVATSNRFKRG